MQDIIQKIITTEDEALAIIEAANAEADRIVTDAKKRRLEIIEKAHKDIAAKAEQIMKETKKVVEAEKDERLARAAIEMKDLIQLDRDSRQRFVEGVVRCVCGQT